MKRLLTLGTIVLSIFVSIAMSTQHPVTHAGSGLSRVDELQGECWQVAVSQDHNTMYGACGRRIIAVDVSDETKPVLIGRSGVFPHTAYAVRVNADSTALYAQFGDGVMRIFDISKPGTVQLVNSIPSPMFTTVKLSRFTAAQKDFIQEMATVETDTSKPQNFQVSVGLEPAPRTELQLDTFDFEVIGKLMYVVLGDQVQMYDLSDFFHPMLLGTWRPADSSYPLVDLAVDNGRLFVVRLFEGISELDASNPANITFVRKIPSQYVRHLSARNGKLITATTYSNPNDSEIIDAETGKVLKTIPNGWFGTLDGQKAVMAGLDGLAITDLTTGERVELRGEFLDDLVDVKIENKVAYVASRATGLHVIDLTSPMSPTLRGSYLQAGDIFRITWPYAAGNSGIYMFDDAGRMSHFADEESIVDLFVSENVVYSCSVSIFQGEYGVQAFAKGSLAHLAAVPMVNGCRSLILHNTSLYVGSGDALRVYDVSDVVTKGMFKLSQEDQTSHPMSLALNATGTLLFVADWNSGLVIYRTKDFKQLGAMNLPNKSAADVFVSHDQGTLYLLRYDVPELTGIDVSDPSDPSQKSTTEVNDRAYNLSFAGNYLWVTGSSSIEMMTLNGDDPQVITQLKSPSTGDVDQTTDGFWAANHAYGFGVYALPGEAPTPFMPMPTLTPAPAPTARQFRKILYLPFVLEP